MKNQKSNKHYKDHLEPFDRDSDMCLTRDQLAIRLILDLGPKLKVDSTEEVLIELPLSREIPDGMVGDSASSGKQEDTIRFMPIRDKRVKAEIAELIYKKGKIIPYAQEVSRILTVLEGMAWKEPIQEIEVDQILNENPFIEAIYVFLKQPENNFEFGGTCSSLLIELTRIGKRKGIDLKSKYWPGGPAQLSKKLCEQEIHLKKVGIVFTRGRRPGGERYVKISLQSENSQSKASDDAKCIASQEAPDDQQINHDEKPSSDTGDDALEAKLASINQPSKENKDD